MRPSYLIRRLACWAGLIGALLAAGAPAQAQTLLGNYPVVGFSPSSTIAGDGRAAVGFTLGATDYQLTGAKFQVGANLGFPVIGLALHAANGSAPGALIHTFTNTSAVTVGLFDATFAPSSALTLAANTPYFLVLRETASTGGFVTIGSSTFTAPTGPGATWNSHLTSSNAGADWSAGSNKFSFEITGEPAPAAAVPEPSAMVLMLPALAVVALCRRLRAKDETETTS